MILPRLWVVAVGLGLSGVVVHSPLSAATEQVRQELVVRRVLLPTGRLELGYLTPPMLMRGTDGVVSYDAMERQLVALERADSSERILAKDGEGPGELRGMTGMVLRKDSLIFTDQTLRRATVLDIRTGRLLATWLVGAEARWHGISLRPLTVFTNSCWVGTATQVVRQANDASQPFRTHSVVLHVRTDPGGLEVDSILAQDSKDAWIHPLGEMILNRIPSVVTTRPRFILSPEGLSLP